MGNLTALPDNLEFNGRIERAHVKMTTGGTIYLQIGVKLLSTAYAGRWVFHRFVLAGSATAKQISAQLFERMLKAAGAEKGPTPRKPESVDDEVPVDWLAGVEFSATTSLISTPGYRQTNSIRSFLAKEEQQAA